MVSFLLKLFFFLFWKSGIFFSCFFLLLKPTSRTDIPVQQAMVPPPPHQLENLEYIGKSQEIFDNFYFNFLFFSVIWLFKTIFISTFLWPSLMYYLVIFKWAVFKKLNIKNTGKIEEILEKSGKFVSQKSRGHVCVDHCREATAQGKQGIWTLVFPDRENREFKCNTGKICSTQGKMDYF